MVDVDKAVFARLNKKGKEFEILVDPELALKAKENLKNGKDADMNSVLAVEDIFFDSKKGIRAGKKDLMPAFDTDNILEVAKIIIKEGKIYTTQDQRHKQSQEKWDKIVALISMNAVDPRTNNPIPSASINDALHKAVFRIDDNKRADDQLPDAIKAVKKLIPLNFAQRTIQINNIPPNQVTICINTCKSLGMIKKQNWNDDKSLTMTVDVPAGLREQLMDKLNAILHGADIKLID